MPANQEELAETARDLARWQGETDATVTSHTVHLATINGSIEKVAASLQAIEKHISSQTKVDTVLTAVEENRRKFTMWMVGLAVTGSLGLFSVFVAMVGVVVAVILGLGG